MSEEMDWGQYVLKPKNKHLVRFLEYAEKHSEPTQDNYDNLEEERKNISSALDKSKET